MSASSGTAQGTEFAITRPGTDDPLSLDGSDRVAADGHRYRCVDGVWDFIRPDRQAEVDRFAEAYAAVRDAEHRSPPTADAVRALPYRDLSGRMADMWAKRAQSFDRFLVELPRQTPGRLVDVGAGCGWLAARMASMGWTAAAVDVTVDGGDGLAAARWHEQDLFLARAEMAALPFASGSVDLVVFNASLHYAADVSETLAEAVRVVDGGGTVVIIDSPVFKAPAAGDLMVEEFADQTRRSLGVEPAPHVGPGYVTDADLDRFRRRHRPSSYVRVDDRSGPVGLIRSMVGARRAGREIAKRPLVLATTATRAVQGGIR